MNEKWNDTLVQRVMKKVEELKSWQTKNSKSGFELVYRDVLGEVEELPECREKYHALADVLMRGWWWIPGEKNDALFARIKEAAELGHNDEVMEFIVSREDNKMWGARRTEFIRDVQIPYLEKAGFTRALAQEWFWLGNAYYRDGKPEQGREAYDRARSLLTPTDLCYALLHGARRMEELAADEFKDVKKHRFALAAQASEFRMKDGVPVHWKTNEVNIGYHQAYNQMLGCVFLSATLSDGLFFADLPLGETYVGSDGTTLTFASDSECVDTPCGRFEGCRLFVCKHWSHYGWWVYKTYYKEGVGIVRLVHEDDGVADECLLSSYRVVGGTGYLPLAAGNRWCYTAAHDPAYLTATSEVEVTFADGDRALVSTLHAARRYAYDKTSWLDAISEIRSEYWSEDDAGQYACHDVTDAVARANALATTPMERVHARVAGNTACRILDTNPAYNPDHTAVGHWNFFHKSAVRRRDGRVSVSCNYRWSFELKYTNSSYAMQPLLYNHMYGILQDAADCIWSDEWKVGSSPIVEYMLWDRPIKTQITCDDGGTVQTAAGCFEGCLKVTLDIDGMDSGRDYRGGRKVYYFAPGVGIVRTENAIGEAGSAVYELTAYEGTGEGYMPVEDGMFRRYDAQNTTDGYVGAVEYTYVADESGEVYIFADKIGVREKPPVITEYGMVHAEQEEERLWESDHVANEDYCKMLNGVNNFHIMLHYLSRDGRDWGKANRPMANHAHRRRILESFAEDGKIPAGWLGMYCRCVFRHATTQMGHSLLDEGFATLEYAFELYEEWSRYPKGELLEFGDPFVFGGIKYPKGKDYIILPDGTKQPIRYAHALDMTAERFYNSMTYAGWYDPARGDERYEKFRRRAKELMERSAKESK